MVVIAFFMVQVVSAISNLVLPILYATLYADADPFAILAITMGLSVISVSAVMIGLSSIADPDPSPDSTEKDSTEKNQ